MDERVNAKAGKSRVSRASSRTGPSSRLMGGDRNDPDYYGGSGIISLDLEAFANSRPRLDADGKS